MELDKRLRFLSELLSITKKLYLWRYTPNMQLVDSNCPMKLLFSSIFSLSSCREQVLNHCRESTSPLIVSDPFGMVWACAFEYAEKNLLSIHVLGPVFTAEATLQNLEKTVNEHQVSLVYKKALIQYLNDIPVVPATTYFEYALMLHYAITNENLDFSDLAYAPNRKEKVKEVSSDAAAPSHAGVWTAEQTLLKMVEEGNPNWKEALNKVSTLSTGVKIQMGDPLRQAKDSVIIFISLCTRAAIKGGLSSSLAYNIGDYYIQNVEECKSITDVTNVSHRMYNDFIMRVRKGTRYTALSPAIKTCCEYVDSHILEKIKLQDMAALTGYTEYYLSRRFKDETGFSINDHIRRRKVEYAKIQLSTTEKSIAEISMELGFSTRSFFTDTFQRITGLSPTQYRTRFGQK